MNDLAQALAWMQDCGRLPMGHEILDAIRGPRMKTYRECRPCAGTGKENRKPGSLIECERCKGTGELLNEEATT